ncbi:hypothetical protein D9758_018938 [Tetrapyrgos nigripes]|uniref:Uncharacterized protein n=1 Tax=Tetrapyrgos nigripes TaxID=182062 RepID=A0A8H5EZ98_9AGAR|nr:hypothetical protein D9758_018938 [Tetrapyrgos nigripes]
MVVDAGCRFMVTPSFTHLFIHLLHVPASYLKTAGTSPSPSTSRPTSRSLSVVGEGLRLGIRHRLFGIHGLLVFPPPLSYSSRQALEPHPNRLNDP